MPLTLTTDLKGRTRMGKDWRQKLWMEFERDRHELKWQFNEDDDDSVYREVEELSINNHSASDEFLQQVLEHIKSTTSTVSLRTVKFNKVLFSANKAALLAQMLSH